MVSHIDNFVKYQLINYCLPWRLAYTDTTETHSEVNADDTYEAEAFKKPFGSKTSQKV